MRFGRCGNSQSASDERLGAATLRSAYSTLKRRRAVEMPERDTIVWHRALLLRPSIFGYNVGDVSNHVGPVLPAMLGNRLTDMDHQVIRRR